MTNIRPMSFRLEHKYVYEYKVEGHPKCEYKEYISEYLFDSPYAATLRRTEHTWENMYNE